MVWWHHTHGNSEQLPLSKINQWKNGMYTPWPITSVDITEHFYLTYRVPDVKSYHNLHLSKSLFSFFCSNDTVDIRRWCNTLCVLLFLQLAEGKAFILVNFFAAEPLANTDDVSIKLAASVTSANRIRQVLKNCTLFSCFFCRWRWLADLTEIPFQDM